MDDDRRRSILEQALANIAACSGVADDLAARRARMDDPLYEAPRGRHRRPHVEKSDRGLALTYRLQENALVSARPGDADGNGNGAGDNSNRMDPETQAPWDAWVQGHIEIAKQELVEIVGESVGILRAEDLQHHRNTIERLELKIERLLTRVERLEAGLPAKRRHIKS